MKNKISALLLSVLTVASLASCGGADQEAGVKAAADYIKSMYQDASTTTTGDLKRVSKYVEGEDTYNVVWTVDVTTDGMDSIVTVGENDGVYTKILIDTFKASTETLYTLTATITSPNGKFTETLTYNYKVPAFVFTSYDEFMAAATGDMVTVRGNVSMLPTEYHDTNNIGIQVAEGGYYAYKATVSEEDAKKLVIGSDVVLTGTKDVYGGVAQVKAGTVKLYTDTVTQPTYVNATTDFTNASSNKDTLLHKYNCKTVQLDNVVITDVTENSNGDYMNFKLGNNTYYMRKSDSYRVTSEQLDAMFANWSAGLKANVKGVVQSYSGAFYLQPTTIDDVSVNTTLSENEKVESALTFATSLFEETYYAAKEISLPTNPTNDLYKDVALSWVLADDSNTDYFAIADGKLNITVPTEAGSYTGKVNVTASVGEVSVTETISINVEMIPETSTISAFLAAGAEEELTNYIGSNTYYIEAVVTGVKYDSGTTNFVISDSTGSIYSDSKLEVKLGDKVIISTQYKYSYYIPYATNAKLIKVVSTGNDVAAASGTTTSFESTALLEVLTASDAQNSSIYAVYGGKLVSITGYLFKNDKGYINLAVSADSTTATVNTYASQTVKAEMEKVVGQKVVITGFVYNVNASKDYVDMVIQSVVAA